MKKYISFNENARAANLARYNTHWDIYDALKPLLDKFEFQLYDFIEYRNSLSHEPMMYSNILNGTLDIKKSWNFGVETYMIQYTESGRSGRKDIIKKGFFSDYDGITDSEFVDTLKPLVNEIGEITQCVDMGIGSAGIYTKDFEVIFFSSLPNIPKDVNVAGSNIYVEFEKLGLVASRTSRHENIINIYKNNSIEGMYYFMGNSDPGWYYIRGKNMVESKDWDKVDEWVYNEWEKVCDELNIKNMQNIRNYDKPKISVPEFMVILKNNQDNL